MKVDNLKQNTPEWDAHRIKFHGASEAPAMMGACKYTTRAQLMAKKVYGAGNSSISKYIADKGHDAESRFREFYHAITGVCFTPEVHVSGNLSASLDGMSKDGKLILEHKLINKTLRECKEAEDLPIMYRIQMEQQMFCAGVDVCLFVASSWKNDNLTDSIELMYHRDNYLWEAIAAGWRKFDKEIMELREVP